MVITQYENKKMIISPKSKKIATSCIEIILSADKGNNILKQNKKAHKVSDIITGFKFAELVPKSTELKQNKKRKHNNKYAGVN